MLKVASAPVEREAGGDASIRLRQLRRGGVRPEAPPSLAGVCQGQLCKQISDLKKPGEGHRNPGQRIWFDNTLPLLCNTLRCRVEISVRCGGTVSEGRVGGTYEAPSGVGAGRRGRLQPG